MRIMPKIILSSLRSYLDNRLRSNLTWIVSVALSLGLLKFFWNRLTRGVQVYDDIVVGFTIWGGEYKQADYNIVIFTLFTLIVSFLVLALLGLKLFPVRAVALGKRKAPAEFSWSVALELALGLIGLFLGSWLVRGQMMLSLAWLLLYLIVLGAVSFSPSTNFSSADKRYRFFGAVLTGVFGFFAVIAAFVWYRMVWPEAHFPSDWLSIYLPLIVGAASGLIAGVYFRYVSALQVARISGLFQLFIPLLLLKFAQFHFQTSTGIISWGPKPLGQILLLSVIALGVGANFWRWISPSVQTVSGQIGTATVIAIACFLRFHEPVASGIYFDDFHLGETILPWHQLFEHGQTLYRDFVSVQGLLGLVYGGTNAIFFDNTLASYPMALLWVALGLTATVSLLYCIVLGSAWGLVLTPLTLPFCDRIYFTPILFLVLGIAGLIKRRGLWLTISPVLVFLNFFWNVSAGLASAVAIAPFYLYQLLIWYRAGSLKQIRVSAWLGLVGIGVVVIIIGLPVVRGLVQFVSENGSTNTVAYGVSLLSGGALHIAPSFPKWFSDGFNNRLLWETIRIGGWVFGGYYLVLLALRGYLSRASQSFLFVVPATVICCWLMIPYSIGRIDQGSLSRTGCIAMFVLSFGVPVCFALGYDKRALFSPLICGLLYGIPFGFIGLDPHYLGLRATQRVVIPVQDQYVSGSELGLPKIGNWYAPAATIQTIVAVRDAFNKLLKPDETYFDLTNRSAFYYFLDKKVPVPYSADYLAANFQIQNRILTTLERDPPAVVWIAPSMRHDRTQTALRCYRLYRYLIESGYRFYGVGENHFLLRPDRFDQVVRKPHPLGQDLNAAREDLSATNLEAIPIVWGQNWERLKHRFELESNLIDSGEPKIISRTLPRQEYSINPFKGDRYDYLLLTLGQKADSKSRTVVEFCYSGRLDDGQPLNNCINFRIRAGNLLVPVGADPNWLRAGEISKFTISLPDPQVKGAWRIKAITPLRLVR